MKRIPIQALLTHQNGMIAGRVEAVSDGQITVTDTSGSRTFRFEKSETVLSGDWVRCRVSCTGEVCRVEELILLNRPQINPVSDPSSLYFQLHRKNQALLVTLSLRDRFMRDVRCFFQQNDYLELQTPSLVESPGVETHIQYFSTRYYDRMGKEKNCFMPTSPEFALKGALSAGLEKVYEIARVYRNYGEDSPVHKPEFWMLEWYQAFEPYETLMDECYQLILYLTEKAGNKGKIRYKNRIADLDSYRRIRVADLFMPNGIDLDLYESDPGRFISQVSGFYRQSSRYLSQMENAEDYFFQYMLDFGEKLIPPDVLTVLYEYPISQCPLSVPSETNPLYGKRFEIYLFGIELANAFEELTDPVRQEENFCKTLEFRKKLGYPDMPMPNQFIRTLRHGLPPSSGIALGLERLFMILNGIEHIQDTELIHSFTITDR